MVFFAGCSNTPPPIKANTAPQQNENSVSGEFTIKIAPSFLSSTPTKGRVFLFLSEEEKGEPRQQIWPLSSNPNHMFAMNVTSLSQTSGIRLSADSGLMTTASFDLGNIPKGHYSLQVLWDHDTSESQINAPGNLYSVSKKIEVTENFIESIELSKRIEPSQLEAHPLLKKVTIESELLSAFWGRPYFVSASVLLPNSYNDNNQQTYPVRYNVAGYGGRFTRANRLIKSEEFMQWWTSDDAPQIITVYLDGEGPFGDSYQLDSDNSGPFGQSLITELIPTIESQYRAKGSAKYRFTDGCSTGGWVSLALQLFYPDSFNGAFSYSPDSVDFSAYQLADIYTDSSVFYNKWNNLRPVGRTTNGDPIVTLDNFIQYENVQGVSNDYRTSGGQFSAHTALYSPKGEDGLPAALFDPQTGEIDSEVAQVWKKYDLKLHTENNWAELGPKLQDKIYIWMGDMDNFFLNPATRKFSKYLQSTENPVSNAVIEFTPMAGHCDNFSNKLVLQQIQKRLSVID
jgi:S-formylglutathione hydrolase FrmB